MQLHACQPQDTVQLPGLPMKGTPPFTQTHSHIHTQCMPSSQGVHRSHRISCRKSSHTVHLECTPRRTAPHHITPVTPHHTCPPQVLSAAPGPCPPPQRFGHYQQQRAGSHAIQRGATSRVCRCRGGGSGGGVWGVSAVTRAGRWGRERGQARRWRVRRGGQRQGRLWGTTPSRTHRTHRAAVPRPKCWQQCCWQGCRHDPCVSQPCTTWVLSHPVLPLTHDDTHDARWVAAGRSEWGLPSPLPVLCQ